jgi:uncharacterized protein
MSTPQPEKRPERPRDRFGRPLPWGSPTELVLEDYESLSLEENHALAIEHFNAGRYFSAHEAWEQAWRLSYNTPDEEFYKGLAQLGAAYTHVQRGNPRGAAILAARALERVQPLGESHAGLDLPALASTLQRDIYRFEAADRGEAPLTLDPPPQISLAR